MVSRSVSSFSRHTDIHLNIQNIRKAKITVIFARLNYCTRDDPDHPTTSCLLVEKSALTLGKIQARLTSRQGDISAFTVHGVCCSSRGQRPGGARVPPVRLHYTSFIPLQCYNITSATMGRTLPDAYTLQVNKERWRHPERETWGWGGGQRRR